MEFDKKNTAVWRFASIFILFNCRKPGDLYNAVLADVLQVVGKAMTGILKETVLKK